MRASIVNVCSPLGGVKVNNWFTLRAAEACGTSKPLQNGRFSSDRQYISHEFTGSRGLDRPFREILDGPFFDSPCGDSLFVIRMSVIYMLAE